MIVWFYEEKKKDLPHTGLLDTTGRNLPNLHGKKKKENREKDLVMQ